MIEQIFLRAGHNPPRGTLLISPPSNPSSTLMKEPIAESKMHALDYWQVVRNRWGTILLTFLLVCLAALIIVNLLEKKHVGRVKLQVHNESRNGLFERGGGGQSSTWLETEFKIITSRENFMNVVHTKGLTKRWNLGNDDNAAVDKLARMVETSEERGTDLIAIEVFSPRMEEAAELANSIADSYEERRIDYDKNKMEKAVNVLQGELDHQEKNVEDKRVAMLQIMKKYNIVDFSGVHGGFGNMFGSTVDDGTSESFKGQKAGMVSFENEVNKTEAQLNALREIKDQDELIEIASGMGLEGITIKESLPKFHQAKNELQAMQDGGLGGQHPAVIAERGMVENLKKELANAVEGLKKTLDTKVTIARAGLKSLQDSSNGAQTGLVADKARQSEYFNAKREYEQQFTLLNEMREHILKQRVDLEMPNAPIQRHENAYPSPDVARPNMQLLLSIGGVIGLVLGLVLAFFLEYLDTSVKTLDDVERYLGVPVLAVIPKDVGVLHKQSGLSPDAEAYRILRTNIEFNRKSADANAITIVSGGAGEGKSTTLVNLAYICAQGGYNTLMIDGDLRRPKLHTFFDINNSVGLTNYLTTALMLEDVILQTPIDNLYFMPSGILPADAAGILNSRRMSELIQDLKNRFDLVLIDSPPILGVSDASVLASEVDLTIIVIQHRKLPRNMLLRVKQAVENVGGNVLGVVLNNVDVRSDSQYQYYTSYYTYYSPTSGDSKPKSRPSREKAVAGAGAAPQPIAQPQDEDEQY